MNWRTRLFEFPGGVLEVQDYGDTDPEGRPGFYMEFVYGGEDSGGVADREAS
ncbi:hypothetical protein [Nocardia thraciensis]